VELFQTSLAERYLKLPYTSAYFSKGGAGMHRKTLPKWKTKRMTVAA
jgi:hypothetical protein